MGHAKKIAESLQTVYAITGYGAENSAGEQVGRAIRELQQAAVYDDALSGPSQTLSDIDGLLNDFNREISAYLFELTFSEEEYYETEKRLDEINRRSKVWKDDGRDHRIPRRTAEKTGKTGKF